MRCTILTVALAIMCLAPAMAPDDPPAKVSLFRSGEKVLPDSTQSALALWSIELLKTSEFTTTNQPEILKYSISEIQDQYRKTVRGDYLVVAYPHAISVKTDGGEVSVCEIIIGLNRPDHFNSSLFTVDSNGRAVVHAKYGHTTDGKNIILPDALLPKHAMTETAMRETSFRIGIYFGQTGHLPADLGKLPIREGYANRISDAWDRPLIYSADSADTFTLTSLGADGTAGGQGDDADNVQKFLAKDKVVQPIQ